MEFFFILSTLPRSLVSSRPSLLAVALRKLLSPLIVKRRLTHINVTSAYSQVGGRVVRTYTLTALPGVSLIDERKINVYKHRQV